MAEKENETTTTDAGAADQGSQAGAGATTVKSAAKPKATQKNKTKQLPPYNVVLLDDDDHTYEYVIEMLKAVFGHPEEKGFQMAKEVDGTGRVIVLTTHKERAELKRDQIMAYGADPRMQRSKASMRSVIEPAEGG
jgi:ATP-dependent Clp protease adaptor protein ClpS